MALAAQAFSEQVMECRKAGMNLHLPKPFDPDSLLAAVLRAVAPDQPCDEIATPGKGETSPRDFRRRLGFNDQRLGGV